MPLWLRRFIYNTIRDHYEAEKAASDKANRKLENSSKAKVAKPNIPNPTYVSKAPKK